jgi:hypothetical protein
MPAYLTHRLEFSPDPLSVTTPSWVDVSSYVVDTSWSGGVATDLDAPSAGQARFVLKNTHRDFEPEYSGSASRPCRSSTRRTPNPTATGRR